MAHPVVPCIQGLGRDVPLHAVLPECDWCRGSKPESNGKIDKAALDVQAFGPRFPVKCFECSSIGSLENVYNRSVCLRVPAFCCGLLHRSLYFAAMGSGKQHPCRTGVAY